MRTALPAVFAVAAALAASGCATVHQSGTLRTPLKRTPDAQRTADEAGKPPALGSRVTPARHWCGNRWSDFMDIFSFGIGVTHECAEGGWCPPAYGLYVEATSLLSLGAITYYGPVAEMDGRGAGTYTEKRMMWGIGPYREWAIQQGEESANYYKRAEESAAWRERMEDDLRGYPVVAEWISDLTEGQLGSTELEGEPAKRLVHRDTEFHRSMFGKPRGWQRWEYIGFELAVPEPFLLHHGLTLRAGIDPSEILDFLLGLVCYDFLQDDRRDRE
jgi:hypothetical protein